MPLTLKRGLVGKRTRITIETDRVLLIAHQRGIRLWCVRCGGEVEFVTFDDPAPLIATGAKVIDAIREEPQGWCATLGDSLMRFLRNTVVG